MSKIDVKQCEYCDNSSICKLWGGIECNPKEYKCPYYVKCLELQLHRYKQAIDEIKGLATINSMTTCWTFLNACDTCDKEEANVQCPQAKLEEIFKKCEALND